MLVSLEGDVSVLCEGEVGLERVWESVAEGWCQKDGGDSGLQKRGECRRTGIVKNGYNIPTMHQQSILPSHTLRRHNSLPPRRQPPSPRPKRPIQNPPVLNLGQVDDALRLDLDVVLVDGRHEDVGGLLGEGLVGEAVVGGRPVDLLAVVGCGVGGGIAEAAREVANGGFGGLR